MWTLKTPLLGFWSLLRFDELKEKINEKDEEEDGEEYRLGSFNE